MHALTIGVLGPFEVHVDGRPAALTTGRLRTLLVALALSAGRPVPVDRLTELVWGATPPADARRSLQTYTARLRRALGAPVAETVPEGVLLRMEPRDVDAVRFERLLDGAGDDRESLAQALALWRGEPFHGVNSAWLERHERPRLVERRLGAIERRVDLDLRDGRLEGLPGELEELVTRYPLRESLWVRLLIALDRSGSPAVALRRYEEIRRRLADELGADPSGDLQRVHADLLAGDTPALTGREGVRVPRQLPAALDGFVGREVSLKALDRLIDEETAPGGRAVVVSAIAGTAGVGKTALAVHWAHRVAERFPDGQLYVDLRGYSPTGQVVDPADALRGFMDALGVPEDRLPTGIGARTGMYRSLLAGRRILVLLDNARDAEQVRPLLPAAPGCLAVVTSRDRLLGLVTAEGAHPVGLDLLGDDEARELLTARLGPERVRAGGGAVAAIVRSCARLPLALAVVAARAAMSPRTPLAELAAELADPVSGLDALTAGDRATDVRAVFSWSYGRLDADTARLFRLLGLHPGSRLSPAAAASLAGLPVRRVRRMLMDLARTNLVTEPVRGGFSLHDLLRAYAAELAESLDPPEHRRQAIRRLLDHYLHTAHGAAALIGADRGPVDLEPPPGEVTVTAIDDRRQALDWFTAERPALTALITLAAENGFDEHCWRLARTVTGVLDDRGYWREEASVQRIALTAARRVGERSWQAYSHKAIGRAETHLGDYEKARLHLECSFVLYADAGDLAGQADAHNERGKMWARRGEYDGSVEHGIRVLEMYRLAGDRRGRALALNNLGWSYAQLGDFEAALRHCREALESFEKLGLDGEMSAVWDSLGFVHHGLGDHLAAVTCFDRALAMYDEFGGPAYRTTLTLSHLGDTRLAMGCPDEARECYERAVRILAGLGHDDAEKVRAKLRALT